MKINNYIPIISLFFLSSIMVFTGCKDDTTDRSFEDEKRYFDLFVSSKYPELSPTPSGLFISVIEEGTGKTTADSDWLLINYVITSIPSNTTGLKVLDTYYENVAIQNDLYYSGVLYGSYKYQHGTEVPGLIEGIETMKEGGKSRFMFTSDLGYGSKGTRIIGPYTSLIYDVELIQVIGDVIANEQTKINTYLDTIPDIKITEIYDEGTEATMYYIEDRLGTGDTINNDSTVNVIYRGYLCDEREFDSNIGGDTLEVQVGKGEVIPGWDIGLTYFRKGGKGRLVIPYQLAYGEAGQLNNNGKVTIPPYETLIFDMEVVRDDASD